MRLKSCPSKGSRALNCLNGMQGVSGSNPLGSIESPRPCLGFLCLEQFRLGDVHFQWTPKTQTPAEILIIDSAQQTNDGETARLCQWGNGGQTEEVRQSDCEGCR